MKKKDINKIIKYISKTTNSNTQSSQNRTCKRIFSSLTYIKGATNHIENIEEV